MYEIIGHMHKYQKGTGGRQPETTSVSRQAYFETWAAGEIEQTGIIAR